MTMKLSLIVAMSENRVIGRDGMIPWYLPDDLMRFRKLTLGHPVVMGRKTYDSIGRLLPGRENIILTRNREFYAEGSIVCHGPEEVRERFAGADEVFVIGGEQVYRMFIGHSDRIHLTMVHLRVDGDAYFPEFDGDEFVETSQEHVKDPISHTFLTLDRLC